MKIRIKTRQEILNSQLFLDVPYTITTNLTFWEVWTGWDQTFSTVSCSSNSYIQSLYTWLFENSEQDETKFIQQSVASQMAIPTETNCWEFLSVRCSSNYYTKNFKNGLFIFVSTGRDKKLPTVVAPQITTTHNTLLKSTLESISRQVTIHITYGNWLLRISFSLVLLILLHIIIYYVYTYYIGIMYVCLCVCVIIWGAPDYL